MNSIQTVSNHEDSPTPKDSEKNCAPESIPKHMTGNVFPRNRLLLPQYHHHSSFPHLLSLFPLFLLILLVTTEPISAKDDTGGVSSPVKESIKNGVPYVMIESTSGTDGSYNKKGSWPSYYNTMHEFHDGAGDNAVSSLASDYPSSDGIPNDYYDIADGGDYGGRHMDKRYRYVGKRLRDRYRMAFGLGKRRSKRLAFGAESQGSPQLLPYYYYLGPLKHHGDNFSRKRNFGQGSNYYRSLLVGGNDGDGNLDERFKRRMDRYRTFFGLG